MKDWKGRERKKKNIEDWERGDCDNTFEFYIKKVLQR